MVSNALLRSYGHINPRFVVILAMAVVVLIAVGCGGNVPTMQSSSMGTVSVSMSDPPSCTAASPSAAVPAGGTAAPSGTFTSVFVTIR